MNKILLNVEYKTTPIDSVTSATHAHSGYQFIYVKNGHINLTVNNKIEIATAPCVIMLNALEEHELSNSSSDYERYYFVLNDKNIDRITIDQSFIELLKFRPNSFRHIINLTNSEANIGEIFKSINSEWNTKLPYYEEKITNDISNLIILLHRVIYKNQPVMKIQQYLLDIQKYIESNYSIITSITQLCNQYYVNKYYLSRTFKQAIGYSPKEYLTLIRLHAAKKALLSSDLTVNEICYSVGFNDINNFIKLFKEKYNTTPLKFRKMFSNV